MLDRRRLLVGSAVMGAGLGVGLVGGLAPSAAAADALIKAKYLTPYGYILGFAPSLYADTGGFFAKEGLDIEILGGRGSAMSVQQVTGGNVLLSRTGGTDLIKAYAKDPSIVAVAEIYQRDAFFVISPADKPIRNPGDMAGKTIGIVSTGGATENLLDMMLAGAGVPLANVERQPLGNAPSAFELVKAGRAAAFIATNDTVFQLKTDKQEVLAWSTDDYARAPAQVYMTSKSLLASQTETIAKFLRGVHAAIGGMLQAPDLAPIVAAMAAKYDIAEAKRPDRGVPVLQNALEQTFRPPYRDHLASAPEAWDRAYELMVKAKIIGPLTDRAFYDDRARKLAFG